MAALSVIMPAIVEDAFVVLKMPLHCVYSYCICIYFDAHEPRVNVNLEELTLLTGLDFNHSTAEAGTHLTNPQRTTAEY